MDHVTGGRGLASTWYSLQQVCLEGLPPGRGLTALLPGRPRFVRWRLAPRPMNRIYLTGILCVFLPLASVAQPTSYNIATVAGDNITGFLGDGLAATSAELNVPEWVAVDSSGNLYIADTANQRIRKVSGGKISTIAGNG